MFAVVISPLRSRTEKETAMTMRFFRVNLPKEQYKNSSAHLNAKRSASGCRQTGHKHARGPGTCNFVGHHVFSNAMIEDKRAV
jgi:hypothetical protein